MKKELKAAKKTTKRSTSTKVTRKKAVVTKPAATKPVISLKTPIQDTPTWVKISAVILILLGYAVYRFWGIAKVNNVTISRLDYYKAMEQQVGNQVLENLIQEALITQAAKQQNYVPDPKKVDDQIATISAQILAQGSTIEEALAAENMTMADVRRMYEMNFIVQDLGRGDVSVTDAEIDKYLTDNKSSLPTTLKEAELRDLAKSQLESEKSSANISNWLKNLETTADIVRY